MIKMSNPACEPFNSAVAAMISAVGGPSNVQTVALSDNVLVHRRRNGKRWRNPVNGRRGFMTSTFLSRKNAGRRIQCESGGEQALFSFLEVYSPVTAYAEQSDLVEIADAGGIAWSVTDCCAELNCGGIAWLEGKYAAHLVYPDRGPPKLELGLEPDTAERLARFERVFEEAGYSYVPINELWCRHPFVSENVGAAFAARDVKLPSDDRAAILDLLRSGKTITLGDCAELFAEEDCPTEKIFAAVAQGLVEIEFDSPFSLDNILMLPRQAYWLRKDA
jgi:hypothetical protein